STSCWQLARSPPSASAARSVCRPRRSDAGLASGSRQRRANAENADARQATADHRRAHAGEPRLSKKVAKGGTSHKAATSAPSYQATPGGLVWCKKTRDGVIHVQLTNFRARIV